jgi:hypothetical protein
VAIKVLPAEFASDPERLARFEQEARAAAALNHPHTRGGSYPLWSKDGTEVHYIPSSNSSGILVAEVDLESFSAPEPVELSDIVMRRETHVEATADGEKFLVTVPAGTGETGGPAFGTRLNVVLNWFEELKRLVPTGP